MPSLAFNADRLQHFQSSELYMRICIAALLASSLLVQNVLAHDANDSCCDNDLSYAVPQKPFRGGQVGTLLTARGACDLS